MTLALQESERNEAVKQLSKHLRYSGVQANVGIITERLMPLDWETPNELRDVVAEQIEAAGAAGEITANKEWAQSMTQFFELNDKYARGESNFRVLEEAFKKAHPNFSILESQRLCALEPSVAGRLAVDQNYKDAEVQRDIRTVEVSRMVNALTQYLIDENTGDVYHTNIYDKAQNEERLNHETSAWLALPYEDLKARYDEYIRVQRLQNMSVDELHTLVREQDEARLMNGQVFDSDGIIRPKLPAEFQIPGKQVTLPWSPQLIDELSEKDPRLVGKLIDTYGRSQINAAIGRG